MISTKIKKAPISCNSMISNKLILFTFYIPILQYLKTNQKNNNGKENLIKNVYLSDKDIQVLDFSIQLHLCIGANGRKIFVIKRLFVRFERIFVDPFSPQPSKLFSLLSLHQVKKFLQILIGNFCNALKKRILPKVNTKTKNHKNQFNFHNFVTQQ